jgi:hypothetical protein
VKLPSLFSAFGESSRPLNRWNDATATANSLGEIVAKIKRSPIPFQSYMDSECACLLDTDRHFQKEQ